MCCDKDDCEMAFMPGNHCYGVDCFSKKHCEITTVKPSNVTVKIAAVRPIAVNPAKDQIAGQCRRFFVSNMLCADLFYFKCNKKQMFKKLRISWILYLNISTYEINFD